jgi:poly-beta-1,6-N-acetyl-D-glucosamine synthase
MVFVSILFWVSLLVLVYTYIGYPFILMLIKEIKSLNNKNITQNNWYTGSASIVIAAYNEREFIINKIQNLYQIEQPQGGLQIICVTDGSTDGSEKIIKEKFPEVMVLHQEERAGKPAAINRALPFITGEIVIFSDANTWLNPYGIKKMLRHYLNPKVGVVAGEKRIATGRIKDMALHGESFYWRYESWVKSNESEVNNVIGAAGELLSIRKELLKPLPTDKINEDFIMSVQIAINGWRVIYEHDAYAMEYPSATLEDEMMRKVRIATGSFQLLYYFKSLLWVFKNPLLSWQYISRKVLRWIFCPVFLITLFFTSAVLFQKHNFYATLFLGQVLFYCFSIAGYFFAKAGKDSKMFITPFYFVFMHLCQFIGFTNYLKGYSLQDWKKVERVS